MKSIFTLLALAAFTAGTARAESEPAAPDREFSEAVSERLGDLRNLIEAKRHDEAARLVATLIAGAADPSYDRVTLSQIRAKVLLETNRHADAVEPLRYALRVGEAEKFIDAKTARELLTLLSRIHWRLSQDAKTSALKGELLETSLAEYKDSLRRATTVTADDRVYVASLLLEIGSVDAAKPDTQKLEAALAETRESLRLAVAPKNDARLLELSILVQLGRSTEVVETLELLLRRQPENEAYWRRLIATHLALAGENADSDSGHRHHLRALLAYERAQSHNLLKSSRDNRSVIGILLALDRFEAAADKLSRDIASGAIEDTTAHRELLASTLLRADKVAQAETAYADAIRRFPKEASPEIALGRLLYSRDDLAGAYEHLSKGVAKDAAPDPGRNRFLLAFLAYELRRYEDTVRWAESAKNFPDANAGELARLTQAAKAALKEAANG